MTALDELMTIINRYEWPIPFKCDRAEVCRVLCRLAVDPYRGTPPDEQFNLESILTVFLIAENNGHDLPQEAKNIVRLTRMAIAETMVN